MKWRLMLLMLHALLRSGDGHLPFRRGATAKAIFDSLRAVFQRQNGEIGRDGRPGAACFARAMLLSHRREYNLWTLFQ